MPRISRISSTPRSWRRSSSSTCRWSARRRDREGPGPAPPRHGDSPRGAGRRSRRLGDRAHHRLHPRLPGVHHRRGVARRLGASGPRPPDSLGDHPGDSHCPPCRGRDRDARPRSPPQRAERRRDRRDPAPHRRLCRHSRGERGLRHRRADRQRGGTAMTFMDPAAWSGRVFIGAWVTGGAGDAPVVEPATGGELGRIGIAAPDDVDRAAERAVDAQRDWARRPHAERAAVLRRAGDLWREHRAQAEDWLVREAGSIPTKAQVETSFAASACDDAAGLTSLPYGELLPTSLPHLSMTRRVPIGVVGIISPFNYPLILSIRAVAPALALGNAVILKPDPRTAVSGGVALAELFAEAGLPDGLLSVLPGGPEVGEALVAEPRVGLVSFTGSSRAGRIVAALAGRHLKRIHLELGGNSALIVLDDVDVEQAVSIGAFGSFLHQGQICMTTGRHLVARSIASRYADALGEHARALPVGNPATEQVALGPIIDEPVALAGDTPYGLALGILTHDVIKALEIADRIPTGIVHVNDQTVGDEVVNPFGGVGDTGGSRPGGGRGNLETFTTTQWVTL